MLNVTAGSYLVCARARHPQLRPPPPAPSQPLPQHHVQRRLHRAHGMTLPSTAGIGSVGLFLEDREKPAVNIFKQVL